MQARKIAVNQLQEAFAAFNRIGAELDLRYRELEAQVARLSRELAAARSAKLRELAEKEKLAARLGALMDALPGGVLVLDAQDRVREENPGAVALLGGSSLGMAWSAVLARAGAAEPDGGGETTLADGRRLACASSAESGGGERILLLTDVSENHRLHEQRSRDKRLSALGEMSARLAHQVRTPLGAALLFLSQLRPADAADLEARDRVRASLRQIEGLVESMLGYLRGESATSTSFCLAALLREAADSAHPRLQAAGGTLELLLPSGECPFEGDRQALLNAVGNLLDNAREASPQGPRVRLELRRRADRFEIRVQDNGRGVDAELRQRIFEPFFSTRPHGTGLGLAVVASAARAHGGETRVSAAAGGGSVFHLLLPHHNAPLRCDGLWTRQQDVLHEETA